MFSTGWAELGNYWGAWPFEGKMYGGSENTLIEVACELAKEHEVTVRLPYAREETHLRGVHWVGMDHSALRGDILYCFDDFERRDSGACTVLVACRSDPPRHTDFDQLCFWSRTHARLMGHAEGTALGGGVRLSDYATSYPRIPQRVIYTSSPDRGGHHAAAIGKGFDYVATYRGQNELTRAEMIRLQQTAMVQIHPYDAVRESEFFCMSILEAMAAGTPCIISDGPALVELWGDAAMVLPKPIDYAEWSDLISEFLEDDGFWNEASLIGQQLAERYDWSLVAARYLEVGSGSHARLSA